LSSHITVVQRLRTTVRLLDEEILKRLKMGTTPIVIQEYIKGRDVRVHVVGDRTFATEVISAGIDYRFHDETPKLKETSIPNSIEELCYKVTDNEGLTISGLDFRVTERQHWYCLEINPVPTFLPYEMTTRQPIGNAILDEFSKM
jgi:D-alanine-D-alanine ligase-like ATP-grasp enzyme